MLKQAKPSETQRSARDDALRQSLESNERPRDSHMQVPGPDGRKGFGGACFPKDISAMRDYALSLDERLSLINQVIKKNNEIRSRYPNLTQRETDQSVSFKDK